MLLEIVFWLVVLIAVVVFLIGELAGCTVAPRLVIPAAPSMDSGIADSGTRGVSPDGRFLVTSNVIAQWHWLAPRYGQVHTNAWGITWTGSNLFLLDAQAYAEFTTESILRDSNRTIAPSALRPGPSEK